MQNRWWGREGFEARDGRFQILGRDVEAIAREHGTPLYVYDVPRIEVKLRSLQGALERAGVRHRLLFAFKSNRHPTVLERLRKMGDVGIDEKGGTMFVGVDAGFNAYCTPAVYQTPQEVVVSRAAY